MVLATNELTLKNSEQVLKINPDKYSIAEQASTTIRFDQKGQMQQSFPDLQNFCECEFYLSAHIPNSEIYSHAGFFICKRYFYPSINFQNVDLPLRTLSKIGVWFYIQSHQQFRVVFLSNEFTPLSVKFFGKRFYLVFATENPKSDNFVVDYVSKDLELLRGIKPTLDSEFTHFIKNKTPQVVIGVKDVSFGWNFNDFTNRKNFIKVSNWDEFSDLAKKITIQPKMTQLNGMPNDNSNVFGFE